MMQISELKFWEILIEKFLNRFESSADLFLYIKYENDEKHISDDPYRLPLQRASSARIGWVTILHADMP